MTNQRNFSKKRLNTNILMFLFSSLFAYSQQPGTLPNLAPDSIQPNDLSKNTDSIVAPAKTSFIDSEIIYTAADSIVFKGNGTGYLHGKSDIKYKSINLKADFIRIKLDSSTVFAKGKIDSIGVRTGEPEFTENDKTYKSKELTYNLKTKKGFIRQAITQEGEGFIISKNTKKMSNDVLCMTDGKFTTCDNHDHPHFYLSMTKGKVKPGEYVVTGPAYLVIADVPLPIALPFAFFPFTSDYSSGILMPSYTDELYRGFGLSNGGYYFAINDYMDLELRGDIYTKGTWALRGTTNYRKRYRFNGSIGFEYRNDVTGEKGMSDYNKANSFSLRWSHAQDQKANPNFTFSSSVNFSTSGFTKNNINTFNRPEIAAQNTKYSSINFSKRFADLPSLSLSGGASVTQRTSDSTISMSLPALSISYSMFYPFKRKKMVGKERWYEKISMSYSGSIDNSITTKENLLLKSSFTNDWRNGMRHNIPISASFNLLKYINISPSFNYTERWYLQSYRKQWDAAQQREQTSTVSGFRRAYDFNMGVSASTKIYGFFEPIRAIFGDKIDRIRHVMSPTIGFGYTPDFSDPQWGFYDEYVKRVPDAQSISGFRETNVRYSHFDGSLYGAPPSGKNGSVNFSLSNNVEMKVRNDNDTTENNAFRIVSLIDQLFIGSNYNLAVDSFKLSNFSVNLRLKLTKTYALSLSTSFDPYMFSLDSRGNPVRISEFRWKHGKLPRFMGTSTSYSVTMNNETLKKLFSKKEKTATVENKNAETSIADKNASTEIIPETSQQAQQGEFDQHGYRKNEINWNITGSYTLSYMPSSKFNKARMEYDMELRHNLSLNASLDLTKNWRFSASTSYDFEFKQFTYTSININRSLHCWSMTGSVVPFGPYKSYTFRIGVNASMLADLKYDKNSQESRTNINWY